MPISGAVLLVLPVRETTAATSYKTGLIVFGKAKKANGNASEHTSGQGKVSAGRGIVFFRSLFINSNLQATIKLIVGSCLLFSSNCFSGQRYISERILSSSSAASATSAAATNKIGLLLKRWGSKLRLRLRWRERLFHLATMHTLNTAKSCQLTTQ